ncbi:MAG TPA: type III-A CRISPR-associated RAMP protein Csm5 [Bryobacteraceae bacterium]|jgi:CRISPR-associated protein Csm5|nr:type III-A CRISPR-associated RAMP protein Csm5 [Bryobacteraceae bacterium]
MKYRVTALTPLLVGDGRELSPIDYMVWKDQVNVLDQPRIFKLLARGPRLEGYLAQLRRATKLDFASWGGFAQNFSQRRIPFESASSTAIWNAAASENLFIPTFAASYRGAYLPASALKGALRTGLVFSRWSTGTMERIASSLEGDRLLRRTSEAAENQAGASQTKIISATDSSPVSPSVFKIFLTRVASLDTRQPGKPQLVWKVAGRGSVPNARLNDSTPVFAEMAVPGASFEGEWKLETFFENEEIGRTLGWRSTPSVGMLVKAANEYAAAQLETHARYAEATGLPALQQTIAQLRQRLEEAQSTESICLLSLGWGGGFVSKAAFLDTDNASYRKILRGVPSVAKSIREGVPFPKTRRVAFLDGQPAYLPGWAALQL